jgi:hypothetical protein
MTTPLIKAALSDGQEVTTLQWMTAEEFIEAEQEASQATRGDWGWSILNVVQLPSQHYLVVDQHGAGLGLIWYSSSTNHWVLQYEHPQSKRSIQHCFNHMAEAVERCLLYPSYGTGMPLTQERVDDLLRYIQSLQIRKQLFSDLEHLLNHPTTLATERNSLGQLVHAVQRAIAHQQSCNDPYNLTSPTSYWDALTEQEKEQLRGVGEVLFEQGKRWMLETIVRELATTVKKNNPE